MNPKFINQLLSSNNYCFISHPQIHKSETIQEKTKMEREGFGRVYIRCRPLTNKEINLC